MSWNKSFSSKKSLEILGQLSDVCASLGGPQARAINKLVQEGRYREVLDWSVDYDSFATSYPNVSEEDVLYSRQILGFFQKLEFLKVGYDSTKNAYDRFIESERMCHETNIRLKRCAEDPSLLDPFVGRVMYTAQCKIAQILGPVPNYDELSFAFGPGANTNVKASLAFPRGKLSAALACSTNLVPLLPELLSEVPEWTNLHSILQGDESWVVNVDVVPGRMTFVPKNAKTKRVIMIEPPLNSFFQKGVGSHIRERLKRFGIDLTDQTRNQRLAHEGSIDGLSCTVDVTMASDCNATGLVADLCPFEWFDFLDCLRTPEVELPSPISFAEFANAGLRLDPLSPAPYRLNKFSSMGNGYTFELESVIFYGLAYAVTELLGLPTENVSVYGDDIIVPTAAYDQLRLVLQHCGFLLNMEKSFCQGFFRESCGADYFNGFDIRPFYQKTLVSERTLFTMHNWFVRHREMELAALVDRLCNPAYKLYGPDGFGDGHLIGTHSLRLNRKAIRAGYGGGYFDTYSLTAKSNIKLLPGDAVLPVYSVYTRSGAEDPTDPNVIRGSCGYSKISIYTLGSSIFCRKV